MHGIEEVSRPPIGVAPRYKTGKPPTTYRYDSSLSPALEWDANPAREIAALKRLQKPFLNRAGKAERLSFDVPKDTGSSTLGIGTDRAPGVGLG